MKRPKRPPVKPLDIPAYLAYLRLLQGDVERAIAALERYLRLAG